MRYWQSYIKRLKQLDVLHEASLHAETPITLVAYFKWQNRKAFEAYFLDENSLLAPTLSKMAENCNDVKVLHRMEIISES